MFEKKFFTPGKNFEKEKSKKEEKEKLKQNKGMTRREFLKLGAKLGGAILAEKMMIEPLAEVAKSIEKEPFEEFVKRIDDLDKEIKKRKISWEDQEEIIKIRDKLSLLIETRFRSLFSECLKDSEIEEYQKLISSHFYSNWHPLIRGYLSSLTVGIVVKDKTGKSLKLLEHFTKKDELIDFSYSDQYHILFSLLSELKDLDFRRKTKPLTQIEQRKKQAMEKVLDKWLLSEKINSLDEENCSRPILREIFKRRFEEWAEEYKGYGSKFVEFYFKNLENLNQLSPNLTERMLKWAMGIIYEEPVVKEFWRKFFSKEREKKEKYGPLLLKQIGFRLPFTFGKAFIEGVKEAKLDISFVSEGRFSILDLEKIVQKGLPSFYKKILKDVDFYKEDSSLESIYGGLARMANDVHDFFELENWKEKVSKFLKHLTDKEVGYLLSYGGFELYTGTYNEVFKSFLERIKNEDFLEWIKRKYPENSESVQQHLLLSLASRKKLGEVIKFQNINLENLTDKICKLVERTGEERTLLSYLMVALEEIYYLGDEKEKKHLLKQVEKIKETHFNLSLFKLLVYYKLYPEYYNQIKLSDKERKIFNLIKWIEKPDYQELVKEKNTIRSIVIFAPSAEGYLEELKNLFKKEKYKDRGYCIKKASIEGKTGYLIKGKITNQEGKVVNLEFYLVSDIGKETFKRIMESGKYSLIFTRHHSYEGERYLGLGSDKVLPQVCGTVGVGKGAENNALVIVATEEIAKGFLNHLSWDEIWQNMEKRMSLDNFRAPNNLSFLFSYASQIEPAKMIEKPKKLKGVVIFDGGCGGVNRIPRYLERYKKAINSLVSIEK
ncbi:hypothetical protein J7K91_00190 [bacterium]|nr:hypothetical protein [bacterium]